ncbi:type I restriction enzyme HsdR N-terminal domain-containing protein [Proteus sp. TJ1640]|uniref:type I restriction enzyme HsdR N-terminal domain-containing protein n=1 Tax=Proteus sp. TJ1640 TaxID=2050968 RepID=UPI000D693F94|nr:type I restriction enzyme HsdR N-terminal domain-containing protein [Proteus sp. TJ1640]
MHNHDLLINRKIVTESDVEQHIVSELLKKAPPDGLGLDKEEILTKHNIRGMFIKKRNNKRNYYPDYLIVINGLPIVVIEVKRPNEDLEEAFSEARLYATEVNALYASKVNPLRKILVTDGIKWKTGFWDNDEPVISLDKLSYCSEDFSLFIDFLKKNTLKKDADIINKEIYPEKYHQPLKFVGGEKIQNEEIGFNSFGEKLISEYRNVFNPNSVEDRKFIAKHGYISSPKNKRYYEPINKVINNRVLPNIIDGTLIDDLSNPRELIKGLEKKKELEGKIILLIGSVGSGKTTFIDHLIEEVIPEKLSNEILWIRINMNNSPVNKDEIYNWLRNKMVEQCISAHPEIDFDDLDVIRKIYSVEINKFNKGIGRLISNEEKRNEKLFDIIDENDSDLSKKTICYTRYLGSERNKLIIVVLDNCDKRTRDEQLLMFEIAQWLQDEFRVLIMLPLRDETYDNHRNRPPLDTAIKDMVFRIEPPMFQEVLDKRVQLIINKMSNASSNKIKYDLGNGILVDCGKEERTIYLTSIVKAIFVHDTQIRRIIVGLAGKNIRRALEIFMEFCTSGHITSGEILKIRQQGGSYSLPIYIITRVLLRMKKRYYKSDNSYLKNLFSIDINDDSPNYFSRYIILKWFRDNFSNIGMSGYKGYFSVRDLKECILKYGIPESVIFREVNYLIKSFCLESEKLTTDIVDDDDLLKITSAGFVHLDMVSDINYLAAVAEDTYYDSIYTAKNIAETMSEYSTQYDKDVAAKNAKYLIDYLSTWQEKYDLLASNFISDSNFSYLSNFEEAKKNVKMFSQRLKDPAWAKFEDEHRVGDIIKGTIKSVHDQYGIFVNLSETEDITGLIYISRCPEGYFSSYKRGMPITVRIDNDIDSIKKKVSLSIVDTELSDKSIDNTL